MNNLPTRSNNLYTDIENFDNYEITDCIAYEMAIRTPLVREYIELKKDGNNLDLLKLYNIENEIEKKCWLMKEDIHHIHKEKYNHFKNCPSNFEKTKSTYITEKKKNKNGDIIKKEIAFSENTETKRKLFMSTSRPALYIPLEFRNDVELNINFNKPIKEIENYIKLIYKSKLKVGKNKSEIIMELRTSKSLSKEFKKSELKKYADWFYIYDCYKILKTSTNKSDEKIFGEIDNLLWKYYDSETNINSETNIYSVDTYKKTILKNMKFFIEEYGYKELLIGYSPDR